MEVSAETLLACNVGSSSLKLTLFARDESDRWCEQLAHSFDASPDMLPLLLTEWLAQRQPPSTLLHRIVHAGPVTEQAAPITADVIEKIRHWQPLAPLHSCPRTPQSTQCPESYRYVGQCVDTDFTVLRIAVSGVR